MYTWGMPGVSGHPPPSIFCTGGPKMYKFQSIGGPVFQLMLREQHVIFYKICGKK